MGIDPDPAVYQVVSQGCLVSPLRASELGAWSPDDFHLYLDMPHSQVHVRHQDDTEVVTVDLASTSSGTPAAPAGIFGSVVEVLQVLAEHPGQRFTIEILDKYIHRLLEPNTLAKYIKRLRQVVGDDRTAYPLLLTDRRTPGTLTTRGPTYFADPASTFLVVSYAR